MRNRKTYILVAVFFTLISKIMGQGEMVTIKGDSLVGRNINGETIREVIGNVVLKQGNITITCNSAVQYIARNDAILTGNVVVRQNNLTIRAPKGFYFGDERIAECKTGVQLNDGKVILTAVNGNYYFNEQRAHFSEDVMLYDTVSTMTCNVLNYWRNEDRAVATENVKIRDSVNTIFADTVVHFRAYKISTADGNVKLSNFTNNVVIYGEHLENFSRRGYTVITEDPVLVQIDTTGGTKNIDTLVISAIKMEAYNDSTQRFIANDSVRMVRGEFASINDYTEYFRNSGEIKTYKRAAHSPQPVLWYSSSQLTGDSITIKLSGGRLDSVESWHEAFILSGNENYQNRFDQISGDKVTMVFDTAGIKRAIVNGSVLSMYYTFENEKASGLTKSSSQDAVILFRDDEVNEVKLYVSPVTEYYPETLVKGNELSFTLPLFRVHKMRPEKNDLISKAKGWKLD